MAESVLVRARELAPAQVEWLVFLTRLVLLQVGQDSSTSQECPLREFVLRRVVCLRDFSTNLYRFVKQLLLPVLAQALAVPFRRVL